MTDEEILKKGIEKLGLIVNNLKIKKLLEYAELVREGNKWVHLVSKRDEKRIISKHILESLKVVPYIPKGARCADIGSGAGFPGIPVKIFRDDIDMTLVERNKKKALFLIEVISRLGLKSIQVIADRIANVKISYQCLLIRCGENLPKLEEEIEHLLSDGNYLLLIKSGQVFKVTDKVNLLTDYNKGLKSTLKEV